MQLKSLDPMANAGPYQRLLKNAAKSFTLTQAQFEKALGTHPELVANAGDAYLVGYLYRDALQLHYAFPNREIFHDHFNEYFDRVIEASKQEDAPRGLVLSFRDRPNRSVAETVFWGLAMQQTREWVEMNWVAVPEMPEPSAELEGGFSVREATEADRDAIADIEAAVSGKPRLSPAGVTSIYENARWLYLALDAAGKPAGYLALRSESGGWGVIEQEALLPEVAPALRKPLLDWTVAFLRNNGGRRIRTIAYIGEIDLLSALRARGFTPGEAGLEYVRTLDTAAVEKQWEQRKSSSSVIRMGDWR